MLLLGTNWPGLASHLSRVSAFQTIPDAFSASEYSKESTEPAVRPYTPPKRGPSLSRSIAWQPPHRLSNSAFPLPAGCARPRATISKTDPVSVAAASRYRLGIIATYPQASGLRRPGYVGWLCVSRRLFPKRSSAFRPEPSSGRGSSRLLGRVVETPSTWLCER